MNRIKHWIECPFCKEEILIDVKTDISVFVDSVQVQVKADKELHSLPV